MTKDQFNVGVVLLGIALAVVLLSDLGAIIGVFVAMALALMAFGSPAMLAIYAGCYTLFAIIVLWKAIGARKLGNNDQARAAAFRAIVAFALPVIAAVSLYSLFAEWPH